LYPDLRQIKDEDKKTHWVYGEDATKLYAGKITNNIIQGVARIVMTDGMLRVNKRYPVVMTVHDELGIIAPDAEIEEAHELVYNTMITPPAYLPGIPLESEVGHAKRYGNAK